jgi:NAD(P)-dependent dehydrogenase (short-subunit alcohol dehydrogenase family)
MAVVTGAGRGFGHAIAKRLADRGHLVLATDMDAGAAARTAETVGGLSMELDVRDPGAHRAAARMAAEHGPLEVWVNNAGVMRPGKVWDHPDDAVRLECEVNLLGVIWGSRAAVDGMRSAGVRDGHIVNIASLSALAPIPGLGVYSATKHGVLGFSGGLQGDLLDAALPITVHVVCPDGANTQLLREHDDVPEAAINWSGPRLLTPDEVGEAVVALLDTKKLVHVMPRWRGWGARVNAMAGRAGLRSAPLLRRVGARRRARAG